MRRSQALLRLSAFLFLSGFSFLSLQAQTVLNVKVDQPLSKIEPTMWGIFFEDINFAADGGLYAELVKNRSFEFAQPLMGWKEQNSNKFAIATNAGSVLILHEGGDTNPRIARVNVLADKGYGLTNEGFRGMGIKKGATYTFSVQARQQQGSPALRVELVDASGKILGTTSISPAGGEWKKYTATIVASETEPKALLNIWFEGKGVVDIDMVSLFPTDTWKNRPGGLRKDLVQLLADMKPGFIRFPGGCIVEGRELTTRYQWKKTVGDIEQREMIVNRWNTEFTHRPAPDYFQTFGLGFFEYFQLAEDVGAEPLPILNCGMACQFNSAEVVPINQLDTYVQDALDLIEFANGSPDSPWGKLRKTMGHEAPFHLKYIGVGNEQWGPQYIERYAVFSAIIKAKYPDIQIVSAAGPAPSGELFDYASKELRDLKADLVDEHYYSSPEWFLKNANRYDAYDRKGPKIFAGEYAAQSVATVSPKNENNWRCALSEAAFMTGLERNADLVHMASYAPLFAHVEAWQWTPDLIWFDNLNAYGTPNYYVQKLFSTNKGTHVLPVTAQGETVAGKNGLYASAATDVNAKTILVKLVNAGDEPQTVTLQLSGVRKISQAGTLTVLKGNPDEVNNLEHPTQIHPEEQPLKWKGKDVKTVLPPRSFSVLKIPTL
ncbi:alpha-L-arabinofuranosidase C-terminal domain-containing protein [Chryseolinea soli]|uniref:non-reducing end alpha-L-arabinofuranosidase n=1 Tax=Chryseolinea soli TaxID=2321403 RepID=A0A385SUZ0_9BACT|nr:alpha-L-arabinofuranosidase C-terminal domain-containing protein [Chryseolinea soli]AYB35029.1 carbohydrate-binding protein [Chryseolinea soli]